MEGASFRAETGRPLLGFAGVDVVARRRLSLGRGLPCTILMLGWGGSLGVSAPREIYGFRRSSCYFQPMSFSPVDITYFLEVVRHGNVGRAAVAVGITQPAISKAIRRLEDTVGVALFERGAHGARLTSDGQIFLESARSFDAQHSAILRCSADLRARHAGMLRIGLTNAASDSPVVQVLTEMVRQRPGMRLVLTIGKSDTLNDAVEKGELDIAVTPSFPGSHFSCDRIELSEDRMQVAARARHPLFSVSNLSLQDIGDCSWLLPSRQSHTRRLLNNILEQAGCPAPRVVIEADYRSDAAMGLVEGTDLLTIVPASVLRNWPGRIEALPLATLEMRRTLVLLTRAHATWSHLMVVFKDLLISKGLR